MKAAADGRFLRYSTDPIVSSRHRHRPGVLHLRRAADQGHRQPGQGRRLVRQRVGLLQPPRRPDRPRRRDALTVGRHRRRTPDWATSAASGSSSGRTSTCPWTAPPSPTTAGSARACPTIQALADAGARVVVAAHLGRPEGRARPGVLACAPVAARLGELLGQRRSRSRPTPSASPRQRDRRRPRRTARSRCWRTSASTTARPARTTTTAARSPTSSPQLADAFVSDGFGVVHRKQAVGLRRRAAAAARDGRPGRGRGRRAAPADRRPRAPLRRRARRLEGLRQARRDRQPPRQGRQAAHRRRHGLHLPQRPGPRGRQEPARGRPARHLPRYLGGPRTRASRSLLPTDIVVDTEFPSGDREPQPPSYPPSEIPADALGLDIGPESAAAFADGARRRAARSSGTARWACSRPPPSPTAPVRSRRR